MGTIGVRIRTRTLSSVMSSFGEGISDDRAIPAFIQRVRSNAQSNLVSRLGTLSSTSNPRSRTKFSYRKSGEAYEIEPTNDLTTPSSVCGAAEQIQNCCRGELIGATQGRCHNSGGCAWVQFICSYDSEPFARAPTDRGLAITATRSPRSFRIRSSQIRSTSNPLQPDSMRLYDKAPPVREDFHAFLEPSCRCTATPSLVFDLRSSPGVSYPS